MDFNEKLETQCRNTLKSGYKQWAYRKYRYDHHGEEGVLVLYSEVTNYLLKSSEKEQFLNLKEVFKNGITYINRNLNSTIKRVLAETREKTVIDRLLRRIEQIADDNSNEITRTRIEKYGENAIVSDGTSSKISNNTADTNEQKKKEEFISPQK